MHILKPKPTAKVEPDYKLIPERPSQYLDHSVQSDSSEGNDFTRMHSNHEEINTKWILRQSDPRRIRWDLFIMACAVYDCFIVPLEISMMHEEHLDLFLVAILIDVVFAMDIVFNFRTTYYDHVTGDEVFDPHKISHHYIYSGHIFIDILATVPFDHIIGAAGYHNAALKLAQLLKLFHVMRLGKIINNIRLNESYKIVIRLAQIILNIIMYVHCCACAWRAVVEVKEKWRPPSEGAESDYYEAHLDKVYSFSLYHAVYMWAGVEINPQTNLEMFFLISVILLGSILRAILFGKMAVLMETFNKESQNITKILDTANTAMKNMRLPEALQYKISDYLLATQHTLAKQEEFEQLMNLIPPSQQNEVSEIVYGNLAQICPVLRKFPAIFKPLIQKLHVKFVYPETDLITQGDQGDMLFYLVKGHAEVEVLDEHKVSHKIKLLQPGQYFGELALLYNTARTASVRSLGYSTVGELEKKDFTKMIGSFPDALAKIKKAALKYQDPWKVFMSRALRQVPYFRNLSDDTISVLMYSLSSKFLDSNSFLFTEGQTADCIYIVGDGALILSLDFRTKTLQHEMSLHYYSNTHRDSVVNQMNSSIKQLFERHRREKTIKQSSPTNPHAYAKMKIESVKAGDVMCSSLALLRDVIKVNCISTQPSVVLCLPVKEIEDLMKTHISLKHEVEAYRAKLLKIDNFSGVVLKVVPPVDFLRNNTLKATNSPKTFRAMLKFKNAVISFIFRKRQARVSGLDNIKAVVVRLKAMLRAEELGQFSLARKIAIGEVHPDALDAFGILKEDELKIPLLAQFAVKVKDVKGITSFIEDRLFMLASVISPQQRTIEEISFTIASVQSTVDELVGLLDSSGL